MPEPLRKSSGKDQLPREMLELCNEVGRLPGAQRDKLSPLCERVGHLLVLQNRLLRLAQDTVDQLQLDVKYLCFDLDMTRGERDALRQQLENM
jgi:hypothetical protein